MIKDSLTTESLRKKFKNNFDLCNFSIQIAQNVLLGGTPAGLGDILQMVEQRADERPEK